MTANTILTNPTQNSDIEFPQNYTVIDIETTGLSNNYNEIIELSALKVRNDEIVDKYSTLVKPKSKISTFISKLTGITNEMVETAPFIENILDKYIDFIGEDVVVGHNVRFDIGFINKKNIQCYDKEFTNKSIDTCKLSRKIAGLERHKLDYVANYYNIDTSGHHRAERDCIMTYGIYNAIKNDLSE
ncbi:3'-5' exonuclease [bacterium]|nr:3'-5' exonuclease [bacterium]